MRRVTSPTRSVGDGNTAVALGESNLVTAGPGDDNTAVVVGSDLTAETVPGDGLTVVKQFIDE